VQETYLRAWRSYGTFEGRSSLRVWLYRIATNACLTALQHRGRRALPSGLGGPGDDPDAPPGPADPDVAWLQPLPDTLVTPESQDPAAIVASREGLRLALIASSHRHSAQGVRKVSDADLPRLLLMSGDRIVDSAGEELARIVRPRWSLRKLFSRTQEEIRLVRPDETILLSLPEQTDPDIHSLWVRNADGARLGLVERRGRMGLGGGNLDVTGATGQAMGTIATGNAPGLPVAGDRPRGGSIILKSLRSSRVIVAVSS
jgi:hypothetical protein